MKHSRRLLFGTFLALLAVPVVLTAYSRISGTISIGEAPPPERSTAEELAALRDFSAIIISGDIEVEIVQAPDYSIEFTPLPESRGSFTARMEQGALFVEAFGNRMDTATATLRIGMPELQRLNTEFLASLAISNFDTGEMTLTLSRMPGTLALDNNRIGMLTLDLQNVDNVELRGNMIGTTRISHFGTTFSTD